MQKLTRQLVNERIQPWLDKWNLILGDPWQFLTETFTFSERAS